MKTAAGMSVLRGPSAPRERHASIPAALAAAAQSAEGLTFVDAEEHETETSFRELLARARKAAGAIARIGVAPGDRVALVLPTGIGFMDAFFGSLLAGAVPVPLYPPVRLGRLAEFHLRTARMLEVTGARLVLTDARIRRLLGVAVERARPALGCVTVEGLVARGAGEELARDARPDELALIQFSSGTTVDPKPVALTHRNVLANAAAIDTSVVPGEETIPESGVSWLPLYHDMGLIGCLLLAVAHPGPLTLIPPELFLARPSLWLRTISRRRATLSVAPNFAYGLCVKRISDDELRGVDLSCWRAALTGAEPVSPEVLRRFAERFAPYGFDARALTPVYGLSEASLAVTFSQLGRGFRTLLLDADSLATQRSVVPVARQSSSTTDDALGERADIGAERAADIAAGPTIGSAVEAFARGPLARELVSVGTPVPGVEVRVTDGGGEILPERRVGNVRVRGPSVMAGYWNNAAATARVVDADGWLDTGDLGFIAGGELYLCGRTKEIVILRGRNHAPQEFEDALDGLAGVRAGCVAAVGFSPEAGIGEELAVLIEREGDVTPEGEHAIIEAARSRIVERTGVLPSLVRVLAPGTLPRTSSGKIRRTEAARQLAAGQLVAPEAVTVLGLAREAARSLLASVRSKL